MPRLIIFAACHKYIVDREDSSVSLISVMASMAFQIPSDNLPGDDAVTPIPWAAVAFWLPEAGDEGNTYEQKIQIILPNGDSLGDAVSIFTMTSSLQSNPVKGDAFPMGVPGLYHLRLSLREVKEGEEWRHITDYPLEIRHNIINPVAENTLPII